MAPVDVELNNYYVGCMIIVSKMFEFSISNFYQLLVFILFVYNVMKKQFYITIITIKLISFDF